MNGVKETPSRYTMLTQWQDLVRFFAKLGSDGGTHEEMALRLVQQKAAEVTENLDEAGLPADARELRKLEADLRAFLSASAHLAADGVFEAGYVDRLTFSVNGQQDPHYTQMGRITRDSIADRVDSAHPILGHYVAKMEETAREAGLEDTRLLTRETHAVEGAEQIKLILGTCLSVARDMMLLIGPDKYEILRQRMGRAYMRYLAADDLLTGSVDELAEQIMTTHAKGYWNALPRVWVEELMLLAVNPAIVQRMIDYRNTDREPVRRHSLDRWLTMFARQDLAAAASSAQRLTHEEYLLAHGDPEIDEDQLEDVLTGIAQLGLSGDATEATAVTRYTHGERARDRVKRELGRILSEFFAGGGKRRKIALSQITSRLSSLDEAFRAADGRRQVIKSTALTTPKTLSSVRQGLRGMAISDGNKPPFEAVVMVDPESGHTVRVEAAESDDGEFVPVLGVFTQEADILCHRVTEDQLEGAFAGNPRLREADSARQIARDLFAQANVLQRAKVGQPYDPEDADSLFHTYSALRYAIILLLMLYSDRYAEIREAVRVETARRETGGAVDDTLSE